MLARRLLVFALILLVVTAISSALAPVPRPGSSQVPDRGPAVNVARTIEREIDAGREQPQTVEVAEGDTLVLTVSSDAPDAVELRGLSAVDAVGPGSPVVFTVFAADPGEHPVVLLDADRQVGTVRVTPRER